MTRSKSSLLISPTTHRHQTEAYVVAANNELWMGAGVAGALKRAAGEAVEAEAVAPDR